MRWLACGLLAVSLALPGLARAQSNPKMAEDDDRFFADPDDKEDEEEEKKKRRRRRAKETRYRGSLTSTTFVYRETARAAAPLQGGVSNADNASSIDRLFSDMRAQLDAKDMSEGKWDARFDGRVRVTGGATFDSGETARFQSGTFSGREYDAREIYLKYKGGTSEVRIGRQFVTEMAAVKIDGIRLDKPSGKNWTYIAYAGLFPTRGSRSIFDDYPKALDPMDPMAEGKRILPVAGGVGGAYRFQKYYGAIGASAILPRAEERADIGSGTLEKPRGFLSANGYYRRSAELDVYHFAVIDVAGSNAGALTNVSVGLNYRPSLNLRINLAVNRVDTETLNVQAQNRLEDRDPNANALVQNNIEVTRISSESARVGISGSMKERRYQVSVMGQLRRRPEIIVTQNDANMTETIIEAAQAAEVTIAVVDRRSYNGLRIGASISRIFGFGDVNLYRSEALIGRVTASKPIKDGRGEIELEGTYLDSADENREAVCADLLTCWGTSSSRTISAGALVHYRLKRDWLLIASASAGSQKLTIVDGMMEVPQPAILMLTGFARLAYRF